MPQPTTESVHSELLSHLVEAASMKVEIEHVKSTQAELTNRLLVSMGELTGDIKAMRAEIQGVPDRIASCRIDMRREIEKDFPNRVDSMEMEKRIEKQVEGTDRKLSDQIANMNVVINRRIDQVENKIDSAWVKITTAIIVISAFIGVAVWFLENISPSILK